MRWPVASAPDVATLTLPLPLPSPTAPAAPLPPLPEVSRTRGVAARAARHSKHRALRGRSSSPRRRGMSIGRPAACSTPSRNKAQSTKHKEQSKHKTQGTKERKALLLRLPGGPLCLFVLCALCFVLCPAHCRRYGRYIRVKLFQRLSEFLERVPMCDEPRGMGLSLQNGRYIDSHTAP